MDLGDLERIDGLEVNGMKVVLLPKEVIDLQLEVLQHHPELVSLLHEHLKENQFEVETYYGMIAAYCGIVLDGAYEQVYLVENLHKSLVAKRSTAIVVNSNIAKVPKPLLQ